MNDYVVKFSTDNGTYTGVIKASSISNAVALLENEIKNKINMVIVRHAK